jgi:hypothetical protein
MAGLELGGRDGGCCCCCCFCSGGGCEEEEDDWDAGAGPDDEVVAGIVADGLSLAKAAAGGTVGSAILEIPRVSRPGITAVNSGYTTSVAGK